MRIGFYFECFKSSGGVYQYALNILNVLKQENKHQYTVFNISPDFPSEEFNLPNWKIINLIPKPSSEDKSDKNLTTNTTSLKQKTADFVRWFLQTFHLYAIEVYLTTRSAKKRAQIISNEKLDLMFFHGPSELSFLIGTPSVVPIHDLQHRTNKGFPEVSKLGQYYKREYLYNNIKKNVYRILVDSQIGKEDINNYYNIPLEKIVVLPPLAPKYIDTKITKEKSKDLLSKFNLPEKFLFYPAQFWPHKNHVRLLEAVNILKNKGEVVPLALSGSGRGIWGTLDDVKAYIKKNNLENQVYLLGYVSNDEMSALYRLATGFIMPTFFGWTNFPIVEAWQMNTPSLYSNVRGCKEQAGDAALLIDPSSSEDMSEKIHEFWNDENLRSKLVENGKKKLTMWTKDDYSATIVKIISEREINQKHESTS